MKTKDPVYTQLPTHLETPDLPITMLGITVRLTLRQGFLLLCGGCLAWHLFQHPPAALAATPLHHLLPLGLLLLSLLFALVRIHERSLEAWLPLLAHYLLSPRRLLRDPLPTGQMAEEKETQREGR